MTSPRIIAQNQNHDLNSHKHSCISGFISSAAEAHFFVPEYHLTDIIYNTNMDSRKSCSTHSFLSFVFGCLQGSELTAGTFLYLLYKRGALA